VSFSHTEKIIKLLKLTASPEDHEALSAIRIANDLLKKNDMTWDLIIFGNVDRRPNFKNNYEPPKQKREAPKERVVPDENSVEDMVFFIRENAWKGFDMSFVDSVMKSFEKFGHLTYKQEKALRKVFETVSDHADDN